MVWALGLMSGTSLDGIDVAAIQTDGLSDITYGPTLTIPYSEELQASIRSILGATKPSPKIMEIERHITECHGEAISLFLKTHDLSKESIDCVGFHGQTILHQSPKKFPQGRTWQIGDGQCLADLTGLKIIGKLRDNDVAHGGEGAPLVPIFHQALCKDLPHPVIVINIGGIANVTWINEDEILAFDTGPGNALINDWVHHHISAPYDQDGALASLGSVDKALVKKWCEHPYFSITPPKSLDRLDLTFSPDLLSLEDGSATLSALTIESIYKASTFFPAPPKSIILAGGGRHNPVLLEGLKKKWISTPFHTADDMGWSSDFLEAQAFAYLAIRSQKSLPITFPETTGAPYPLTGGVCYDPPENS